MDLVAALDAFVCNDGRAPTFVREQSNSYIDVTFASARLGGMVKDWMVRDEDSLSYHQYISFDVCATKIVPLSPATGGHMEKWTGNC